MKNLTKLFSLFAILFFISSCSKAAAPDTSGNVKDPKLLDIEYILTLTYKASPRSNKIFGYIEESYKGEMIINSSLTNGDTLTHIGGNTAANGEGDITQTTFHSILNKTITPFQDIKIEYYEDDLKVSETTDTFANLSVAPNKNTLLTDSLRKLMEDSSPISSVHAVYSWTDDNGKKFTYIGNKFINGGPQ